MDLLVVGSVAFDSIETRAGKVEDALGGSASFFSLTASHFCQSRLVAVVGTDFPDEHIQLFKSKSIDTGGLVVADGRTFRWSGRYADDFSDRETLDTQLNVFEHFDPDLPAHFRSCPVVFLANIHPVLQLKVLDQIESPQWVAMDTMNFWIDGALEDLKQVLKRVNALVINDSEATQLTGEWNLVHAARVIQDLGPEVVVIKRGEYGALLFGKHKDKASTFFAPALPLQTIVDPTGAGDSFAGGMMGVLASLEDFSFDALRQAVVVGSVMGSFCVEAFGVQRLIDLDSRAVVDRIGAITELSRHPDIQPSILRTTG